MQQRKWMFCSVIVLLLFVVVAGCTSKGRFGEITSGDARKDQPGSTFLENLQADLPQPTVGQFSTPESVVEAFFEAVNDHDLDSALKCFPIMEKYHANTVDNHFSLLHTYELQADAPITSFESHNFFKNFLGYEQYWEKFYMLLFLNSNPDIMGKRVVMGEANAATELKKIKEMKVSSTYSKPEIVAIHSEKNKNVMEQSMSIQEIQVLEVKLYIDGEEQNHVLISVGKIGSNWRILNMS
ncbi:hypothetical protein [Paenibacillus kribbensis]|uniref:hypothetical protein n=1 Tax=Paenibacillus kribbensis TaxID=172713 RepID=UPI0015C1675A|nr:hypothetical protein [Paenibacillus kribbensis]